LCGVGILQEALENCGVVTFLRRTNLNAMGPSEFDKRHRAWCRSIVRFLRDRGLVGASFGHAAKLLGMYLKGMVVLGPGSDTPFAQVAHPPLDGILLSAISASGELKCAHRHAWDKIKWTQLDEAAYYTLIAELRSCAAGNQPFWKLERFWTVTRNKT